MTGSEIFAKEAATIHEAFPKLKKSLSLKGEVIVAGEIDVVDDCGKFWESYHIEIHPSNQYPFRYPDIYEIGGKIPKIGDWHIWEDSLTCCMGILPEEILNCQGGISLEKFVRNELLPYFFNQTFRRNEGYYPNGEYAHGAAGIFQYYDQLLRMNGDVEKTVKAMIFLLNIDKPPGRTWKCFCGSGEKYRRCHREAVDKIKRLGRKTVQEHAELLTRFYNV